MLSTEYGRLKAPALIANRVMLEKSAHGYARVDRELLVMNERSFQ